MNEVSWWCVSHCRSVLYILYICLVYTSCVRGIYVTRNNTPSGFIGKNCLLFGRSTSGETILPLDNEPKRICRVSSIKDSYLYSYSDEFSMRLEYGVTFRLELYMNMHARANGGKAFVSDVSRESEVSKFSVLNVNMKQFCGRGITISKGSRPMYIHYNHRRYGTVNCTLQIYNQNTPFYRIALQFLAYEEINGFSLSTNNIGLDQGLTFNASSPPDVTWMYVSPGDKRSGYGISISGSGSYFMRFRILLHTFHDGVCYDGVCKKNHCLPEAYKCAPFNPCGDNTQCPRGGKKLYEHLFLFCICFTAILMTIEFFYYHCRGQSCSDDDTVIREQTTARISSESEMFLFGQPSANIQPSAPAQPPDPVQPSAPATEIVTNPSSAHPAPGIDLPPSYDEVVTNPDKY